MKKIHSKKMMRKKVRFFSLLEIIISLAILVLISTILGVKVVDLISEHRFKSSMQTFGDDLKQLQMLSISHGSDCSIEIFKKRGVFYYECFSEAEIQRGSVFSRHALKGISSFSADQKKQESLVLNISSTGRIEPLVSLGFHKLDNEALDSGIWIDLRRPLIVTLSEEKPGAVAELEMPSMPKIHAAIDK